MPLRRGTETSIQSLTRLCYPGGRRRRLESSDPARVCAGLGGWAVPKTADGAHSVECAPRGATPLGFLACRQIGFVLHFCELPGRWRDPAIFVVGGESLGRGAVKLPRCASEVWWVS